MYSTDAIGVGGRAAEPRYLKRIPTSIPRDEQTGASDIRKEGFFGGCTERQFTADLQREDDIGLVIRGHLHVERQLIELASSILPFAARCDWDDVSIIENLLAGPWRGRLMRTNGLGMRIFRRRGFTITVKSGQGILQRLMLRIGRT